MVDKQEKMEEIVEKLDRDIKLPPYDSNSGQGYSRQYQQFKEAEKSRFLTRYERLCIWMSGLFGISAGERSREKLSSPIALLDWQITPGMVLSAAVGVGLFGFIGWLAFFMVNLVLGAPLPTSLLLLMGIVPFAAAGYTYTKPVYSAKNKVVRSSGEMILSILYMVVYMRASPNLEGAVRFAALNLDGPISDDLKSVLWKVEVGDYTTVAESLHEYTKIWKGYNDDFLQSLQLIEAAMNEPGEDRRERMLQDAIDSILDGTREQMKHYAQELKTPVMILNALGAMLPVLGMIMLPLISVFLGGIITRVHLLMLFNIMLPATLYWVMQRLLSSRPPTTSTEPADKSQLPERGKFYIDVGNRSLGIPSWIIGAAVFLVISSYGWIGYLIFPYWYPIEDTSQVIIPGIFSSDTGTNPITMLLRSVSITYGLGMGIGVSKYLGNTRRRAREQELKEIEQQFPRALFQLGNQVSGGTPIEKALREAADSTRELEISGLFETASENIRELGMTFEQSLFDDIHGALNEYPSKMIKTVMKSILESSSKGTEMASITMMTISRYLQNIHETQETLNDLLEDTTTTITMMSFLLAPVVSAVAVGMSQTIISAMFLMSQRLSGFQGPASVDGSSLAGAGFLTNLESAIKPEMLQFVVGIYLIQLLFILGNFYVKITEGEDETLKHYYTGKIMMVGLTFYSIVVLIVSVLFGGVVSSIAGGI